MLTILDGTLGIMRRLCAGQFRPDGEGIRGLRKTNLGTVHRYGGKRRSEMLGSAMLADRRAR
jgi:hypothetical protein